LGERVRQSTVSNGSKGKALQLQTMTRDGMAEGRGIGWDVAYEPAEDGELRTEQIAFGARGQDAASGLFGESHGVFGEEAGHGGGNFCGSLAHLAQLASRNKADSMAKTWAIMSAKSAMTSC